MNTGIIHTLIFSLLLFLLEGCMKDDQWIKRHQKNAKLGTGVFILNEGNFMYGNSTLSFYEPSTGDIKNELFYNINGLPLGDVGQSMNIIENRGYISVNNSGKIYIIDTSTGKYLGKITGLTSPRYIHFINKNKGYISDLYAGKITVFNPENNNMIGIIPTLGHSSTEQMAQVENNVYVTCWSFDNTILVLDAEKDSVIREIKSGKQPGSIVADKNNKLWVLCDGGWGKTGITTSIPVLQRINPETGMIELNINLPADANSKRLTINGSRDTLFFMSQGIWKMSVNSEVLPSGPFIHNRELLYGLAVNPQNSEVYFSDAIDYMQRGIVYRFTANGIPIDSFKTGIIPGAFCFKQ